jgi:hypothetical protein
VNTSLLGRTLGIPGQLLGTRTQLANAPGFGTSFAQALGGGLGGLLGGAIGSFTSPITTTLGVRAAQRLGWPR